MDPSRRSRSAAIATMGSATGPVVGSSARSTLPVFASMTLTCMRTESPAFE